MKKLQSGLLAATLALLFLTPNANAFSLPSSLGGAVTELKNLATGNSSSHGSTSPSASNNSLNQNSSSFRTEPGVKVSGGAGPDIVGIRLDMTPSQAMIAVRARPTLKHYQKEFGNVLYTNPEEQLVKVPNGRFLNDLAAYNGQYFSTSSEHVKIYFTPAPGKQRVAAITRRLQFKVGEEPTIKILVSALIKKYGKPTAEFDEAQPDLYWTYSAKFKHTRFPVSASACQQSRIGISGLLDVGTSETISAASTKILLPSVVQTRKNCADVLLHASMIDVQAGSPLVRTLHVSIVDYPAAERALKKSEEISKSAANGSLNKATQKGQGLAPSL